MASGLRINKAVNFAGKSYVVTSDLTTLLTSAALTNDTLILTLMNGSIGNDGNESVSKTVDLTPVKTAAITAITGDALAADEVILGNDSSSIKKSGYTLGGAALPSAATSTVLATEKAVKDYVDGHAIGVTAGTGISIDKTNPLDPVISTNLKIAQLSDPTAGYAASYQLQYWDPTANDNAGGYVAASGDTIDIVKDQFIKSATFGWSTANDATGAGWTTTKSTTAKYPCIKIEVWTNVDGDSSSSDSTATELYIPLNDVFADKTAGNGIDATALASNEIAVLIDSTSGKVVATSGAAAVDVLSVSASGVKVANIQDAIDVAVNDEHAKASAAVSALSSQVVALGTDTNSAVTALNTRIETVATNAATAAANAQANAVSAANAVATNAQTAISGVQDKVSALDSKVDSAFAALDTAIETAIDAVESSVTAHTANAVQVVESSVTPDVVSGTTKYSATVAASHILGVFDPSGKQIYPEIVKGTGSYTLTADYGAATADASWTVVCTKALTAYAAVDVADTTYDVGTYAAVSVANGAAGEAATTVANGDAATAPTAPAGASEDALSYK